MQANGQMTPARIGNSTGYFAFGIVFTCLGALFAMGGGLQFMAVASLFTTLGAGLVAIGFWVSLFGKIEQRLMDLEVAVVKGHLGGLKTPTD